MIVTLCSGSWPGTYSADQRVAGLVIGGIALLFLGHGHGPALGAHHDLVLGILELVLGHYALAAARGKQCRLVHEIGEIGAREARRAARDDLEVDIGSQRNLADMDLEDFSRPMISGAGTTT